MSEHTDDIIDGLICDLCGHFFQGENPNEVYEHGYPATCWECWADMTTGERKQHQRAFVKTFGSGE